MQKRGCLLSLLMVGCGQVEFGTNQLVDEQPDAGLDAGAPDLAPEPDMGPRPDLGPEPDLGCAPVELPTGLPESWPFVRSESGYRDLFWTFTGGEGGCSASGRCHATGDNQPLIPFDDEVAARLEPAIDSLWSLLGESPPLDLENPSGRLWRHLSGHPEFVAPSFIGPIPARLDALRTQASDCRLSRFAASRPDAGIQCEPDSGMASASCPCPVPDLGLSTTEYCEP